MNRTQEQVSRREEEKKKRIGEEITENDSITL